MDAFIFLALIVIYVTISYVPVSEMPKRIGKSNRTEQSSRAGAEPDRNPGRRFVTGAEFGTEWRKRLAAVTGAIPGLGTIPGNAT